MLNAITMQICSVRVLILVTLALCPGMAVEDEAELEEGSFASEVHVAKLEFERVEVVFVVSVFIMVVVLAKLGK